MVSKYFPWVILRKLLIKIRSKYPSEDAVTIITLIFWLGRRAELMPGGRGQHDRRGSKATHAQVDAPHMIYVVLNKANTLKFGYF